MFRMIVSLGLTILCIGWHATAQAGNAATVAHFIVNEGADKGWNRVMTKDVTPTADWTEQTLSFTPPNSGKVQFVFNSTGGVSWLDAIAAEGATISNGDFEEFGTNGAPLGWSSSKIKPTVVKDQALAKQGTSFLKFGKTYIQQWLAVEANKPVTIKLFIKRANPAEDDSALSTEQPAAAGSPVSGTANRGDTSKTAGIANAVECAPRGGLPNFFAKCNKGEAVKIGYLGGSITSQSGWRIQSRELLQKLFPQAKMEEIYAAIGGTGADLGVFRLERDVLQYKPDLVFVEFASNGGNRQNMEGIVRSIWQALPDCDICFVYTVAGEESQRLLEAGQLNKNASVFEQVAAHYGIPSIHMGVEAARLAKEGKLQWKAPNINMQQLAGKELDKDSGLLVTPDGKIPFAGDGVHPYNDTGHKLYTAAIERSLPVIRAVATAGKLHAPLPAPMGDDYVRSVSFLEVSSAKMTGDWKKVEKPGSVYRGYVSSGPSDFERFLPSVWCGKPNATLQFKFKGKTLMLYTLLGPGSGKIKVEIDGKSEERTIFDSYGAVWRLSPVFFRAGSAPDQTHTATITVLEGGVDKRDILNKSGQAQKFDSNPAAYAATDFILGGICIEGGSIVTE